MNSSYIHTFETKTGLLINLRPLQADDAHHLVDLFNHMGPTSRYLRFNMALTNPDPDLVWAEARRLAQIDPNRDGASGRCAIYATGRQSGGGINSGSR